MEISIGVNINDDSQPFTDLILNGEKTIETRNTPTLRPYLGKRVGIVSTSKKRKAKLVGYVDIVKEIEYTNKKQFDSDYNKHLVDKDSPFYIKDIKYGYVLSNPERIEPRDIDSKGIISRSLIKEAMEISKKDLIQNWLNNPKMLREDAEDANFVDEITKRELEEEKKKADRCLRIARERIRKSSAYRSGNIVRCRQGKIWTDLKEEEESLDEKTDFSKEKSKGLHGWFERQGGKGKSKGWVDCNTCRTVDGKKKCKTCGRQKGEKRAKYPACRPTPSACSTKGKGKSWGKKSANEDVLFEQTKQDIQRELKLNEIKSLFKRHIGKL